MSWDVSLFKFSRNYQTLDEIPENEQPFSLSSRKEIQTEISSVFPNTNWNDPIWGIFDSEFGSIEFNIGKDDPVQSLALHVRASDAILGGLFDLCHRLGCQAIDLSYSTFLDQSSDPTLGLEKWRTYREQVIREHNET